MPGNDDIAKIEASPLTDFVEEMEAIIGAGHWEKAPDFFTADVVYQVGHRDPVFGVDGIKGYMEWQNRIVRWEGHDLRMKFSRGQTAIFEVVSHFTRLSDGAKLHVPCTDIYNFVDGRIADWRVYSDLSAFSS